MALVNISKVVRLDIPHEPEEWVEVRPVTGYEMDEAEDAITVDYVKKFGSSLDVLIKYASERESTERSGSYKAYDWLVLFKHAVLKWSYSEEPSPATFKRLDTETRDWLHRTIVEMNKRPPEKESDSNSN